MVSEQPQGNTQNPLTCSARYPSLQPVPTPRLPVSVLACDPPPLPELSHPGHYPGHAAGRGLFPMTPTLQGFLLPWDQTETPDPLPSVHTHRGRPRPAGFLGEAHPAPQPGLPVSLHSPLPRSAGASRLTSVTPPSPCRSGRTLAADTKCSPSGWPMFSD